MKSTAFLVNVSRGAIVDQSALVDALREGRLAGVGVDVVDPEPLPADDPLLALPNVVGAPHSLGYTDELLRGCVGGACDALLAVAAGRVPPDLVNPDVLDNPLFTTKLARFGAPTRRISMSISRDRLRLLHGTDAPFSEMRTLRAGPVSMLLDGVDLRYLRIGGTELVRRIYPAVRDVDWDTVPGVVSGLELDENEDGFRLEFDARHARREVDFSWHGTITGDKSGRVEFVFDGKAEKVCPYNRIGICVHHPWRETKGAHFRARTADGESEGTFPDLIGAQRFEGGVYHALFPAFDRLEVDLARRRARPARVRGRPLGDGGPPELDRRELQDVLDPARARPACAARGWRRAPSAARRDPARRADGRGRERPCAAHRGRADGHSGPRRRAGSGP